MDSIVLGLALVFAIVMIPVLALLGARRLLPTVRAGAFFLCAALFGASCLLAGFGSIYLAQPPQGIYQTHYANRDLMSAIALITVYQTREGRLPTTSIFKELWAHAHGNKGFDYAPSYPERETPDGSDKTYRVGVWEGDDFLYYDSAQSVFYYGKLDPKGPP